MRRLLILVSAVVFVDTMMFAAIIPLIPAFVDDYGLSKLQAGLLVGAYGAGAMIGGIPAGLLAARIGPKRTVVLGLIVLALASVAFAFGGSPTALGLTRFAQGLASAVTWSGALAWLTLSTPRARRGQMLGTAFGFAVLGFIVGPAVGAVAELTSVEGVFAGIAVVLGLVALAAASFPAGRLDVQRPQALRRALRDTGFLAAVWLTLVPALFFGVLDVPRAALARRFRLGVGRDRCHVHRRRPGGGRTRPADRRDQRPARTPLPDPHRARTGRRRRRRVRDPAAALPSS